MTVICLFGDLVRMQLVSRGLGAAKQESKGAAHQTVTKLTNDGEQRAMFRVPECRFLALTTKLFLGKARRPKAVQAMANAAAN